MPRRPVTVVFDHFGGVQAAAGLQQPGFPELVELVKSGKAYVKISGAYRSSNLGPEYSDVVPFAKALIAANPDRIIWGTDWPHPDSVTPPGRKPTDVTPLLRIDVLLEHVLDEDRGVVAREGDSLRPVADRRLPGFG